MLTMAAEGILSPSIVSVVEDILRRHGTSFRDSNLEYRKAEEASLRRYEAAGWLRKSVGVVAAKDLPAEPSEDDFRIALRSGIILCNVVNKIQPGAIPKVVEAPNDSAIIPDGAALMAYQYFENVRNFLVNMEEMGLPTFDASDFEQGGKTARIVNCVLALKAFSEGKHGGGNRSAGYLRPPISPKPSSWKNSEPFMNSISRGSSVSDKSMEASSAGDDSSFDLNSVGNIQSINMLVRTVLANRRQEEIPSIVESMLSKVMQEFQNRLSGQNGSVQSSSSDMAVTARSKLPVEPSLDETPTSSSEETDDASSAITLRKEDDSAHYPYDETLSNENIQNQQKLLALRKLHVQELKHDINSAKDSMQFMKMKYTEDMNILGNHLFRLVDAASGYHKVLAENRKLYNLVQDLKGNIRVYCRVRPFLPGQVESNIVGNIDEGNLTVLTPSRYYKEGRKSFTFNKVFGPMASQAEVFADTQPLVRSVLDGYNVCIFAYGQTGTGKTYTMSGPRDLTDETLGVNYRALNDLFSISIERKDTVRYEVSVQMMEIYNEQVRDLLVTDGSNKKLEIRNSSQNGINVPDANRLPVSSAADVIRLMDLGQKNRAVSSTALNDRSSRSHSCLTVHVQGKDLQSGAILHGSMHLVDLAGSERVEKSEVSGDRLKEAVHINKSLSALGDVIASLAQKGAHVPYRNSKLTQLLQDSLGGKAKTLMFIHISPELDSIGETLSTLKFAERVSTVELGAARVNKESSEVKELREQIANLKAALAKKEEESEISSPESRRTMSNSSSPSHHQRRVARSASRDQRNAVDDIDIKAKRNSVSKARRRSLDPYLDLSDFSPLNGNVSKQAAANGDWLDENILKDGRDHGRLATSNVKDSQYADILSMTPERSQPGSIADDAEELDAATSDSSELEFQAPTSFRRVRSLPDGLPDKLQKPQVRAVKPSDSRGILPMPPLRRLSAGGCPPSVKTGRPLVNTKRRNGTHVSK